MIIRILDEGQYDVPEASLAKLEALDAKLNTAIEAGDESGFASCLEELLSSVRQEGSPVDASTIVPSDLTLPHEGVTLEELKELLSSEPLEEAPEGV